MIKENARIISVEQSGEYTALTLHSPGIAGAAKAGQFANVRATEGYDPLLRRPLSIMDSDGETLRLLVQVRGKGTEAIAAKRPGEKLNLIGPLGNSFPKALPGRTPVFVAGGAGAAPFRFLSRTLGGGILLLGARHSGLLPDTAALGEFCEKTLIATDDGSEGLRGTVVDLLAKTDPAVSVYYACGPKGMLRAFQSWVASNASDAPAYVSLETYMACGIGGCKGCVVPLTDGSTKLCCTDGPVFSATGVAI